VKNFQQNLLIALALALCVLCVYQWYGQTVQRSEIDGLNQLVYQKSLAIQGYTNSIATMDGQISQMDARLTDLKENAKSNAVLMASQQREMNRLQNANEGLTNAVGEYKKGVESLEAKLKEAYDGIQKQNQALKELAAQRDEFVKKFNDTMTERNEIVGKYNDLAKQVEKLQDASAKK